MKKLLTLFLCLLLAAALTAPALADVIWEPMDDFYFEHMDECRMDEADYTFEADVTLYKSPEDPTAVRVVPAGETRQILCRWTGRNGDEWGYIEYYDNGWVNGWFNLSQPGGAPAHPTATLPVVLTVCVLAAAAILILFIKPKKR